MATYRAIFEEITSQREENEQEKKQEASEIVDKGNKITTKTIGKTLTTGIAVATIISQLVAKNESASNTITGNSIAQIHLNNTMAYLNEGLKIGGTLGIAAIVNPATIPLAVGGYAVSYALRGYDISNQNQIKNAQWQVQSIVNQEKQNRLVQNIAENRLWYILHLME